ncbi:WbuC family cupin fold metalloprotein [Chitinivibrio alkaliphilus]|nr:WbuC family cupin fold metalloprotein [Chitinivibrio alkaliphilus]
MNDIFPKGIHPALEERLLRDSRNSHRRRSHYEIHDSLQDSTQRFLNIMQRDSYIPPHTHTSPGAWELFTLCRGAAEVLLFFDETSTISQRISLRSQRMPYFCEIPAGIAHSVYAQEDDTILLEIKPGPYTPKTRADQCAWAPSEESPQAKKFLQWLKTATIGDSY